MQNSQTHPSQKSGGARADGATNSSYRILVVDDDPAACKLSTEVLVHQGYGVDTAADGEAAWEALNARKYDLLITDNRMPKVSGIELVEKLRSARMALPVILASGTIPEAYLNRFPLLDLAATLSKPFTTEELLGTVRKVLYAPGPADQEVDSSRSAQNPQSPDEMTPGGLPFMRL